ncbi:hypothetical protein [Desulfovibrio sp. ZJ200]|uniref:plasmid mobilization protein n=1 Tax=Desulfovibrio sp. ZJ200 TaxID=2709792 RepID=UPI001F14A913|nr:hypothetical protein [Desulfovibrio sp. ZJ200]
MEKRKAAIRFQKRRTLRLTAEEDARITRQATTAGISVSEFMRRLFFGGRSIIAGTDDQTIRELRRLWGLLKHHLGYRVDGKGEIVRNALPKQVTPCPRAEDFENATGEKSAQRIAQEKGRAVIQSASCWEELHAGLDEVGLRFVRKGAGR